VEHKIIYTQTHNYKKLILKKKIRYGNIICNELILRKTSGIGNSKKQSDSLSLAAAICISTEEKCNHSNETNLSTGYKMALRRPPPPKKQKRITPPELVCYTN